ncbi:MAG: hypothetical protein AAF249_05585 [Pseudomonadota bacterium]
MREQDFATLERVSRTALLLSLGAILGTVAEPELRMTSGEVLGIPATLLPKFSILLCISAVFLCGQMTVHFGYLDSAAERESLDQAETESIEMLSATDIGEPGDDANVERVLERLTMIQERLARAERDYREYKELRLKVTVYPPFISSGAAIIMTAITYFP